jgi:flagellar biosynthesis protein FlhA
MSETSAPPAAAQTLSLDGLKRGFGVLQRSELLLAIGMVGIMVCLLLPMPNWLLDIALAFSITFSVMIFMTALFIHKPLEFSVFPAILLISTMLRLALNIASTRLILSEGHTGADAAGDVIASFGTFMMGGSFIIGLIVFAILVIVNFVVITKGSGRIAEVAARFSLDAMPGKQMAIDADLSSGLINEDQARARRKELEEESTFFGSMDGAAKFVRGDAIAGLIITAINLIGGILIGALDRNMSLGDAAQAYTFLSVGDGLVSQIPALIVSVAAGLLVSKAGVSGSTEKAVFGQIGGNPTALGMTSGLLGAVALLPGMPFLPFMALAGVTGALAWNLRRKKRDADAASDLKIAETAEAAEQPISESLAIDLIRIELGYGLLSLVNNEDGKRLTEQIKALRRQLAHDMGFVLPAVRIQDNLQLPAEGYVLRIKEIEAGRGELKPHMLLCMDPRGEAIPLPGEATREPTFGLPAMWIAKSYREEAHFKGLTVVDASTVITTHLAEAVKENMAELLSYAETQKLLDEIGPQHQRLVSDVIPSQISVGGLQRVMQNLLGERVSVRDLPLILEGVAEASAHTRNIGAITEHVRSRLARQLCDSVMNQEGLVPLVTLSPEWELAFAEALIGEGEDKQLSMAPSKLQKFITDIRTVFEKHAAVGENPALLTSPGIRPYVRSIIERFRPLTVVMSQNEINPRARIKTLGQI